MERKELLAKFNEYAGKGQVVFTTFHQSYGYEEFIQGMKPDLEAKELLFRKSDGVFKKIADRASQDTAGNNYVIIIDEINRGNISKIFGELITLIEEDKRWGEPNQMYVTLPLGDSFAVPNNLYIIGTMNSADKSISLVDTALRRRFSFIEKTPDENYIEDKELKKVFTALNQYIVKELRSSDLAIGHSFFIGKTVQQLDSIMNDNIIPLLYEYFFDDGGKVKKALDAVALAHYDVQKADGTVSTIVFKVENPPFGRIKVVKKEGSAVE